jgi:hypothetical protein
MDAPIETISYKIAVLGATRPRQPWSSLTGALVLLALLLGGVLALLIARIGIQDTPIDALAIERITLPERDLIVVDVVNRGSDPITIAQMLVDDAYWDFAIVPGNELPSRGHATIRIPYPWTQNEPHQIVLLTSSGATFDGEVPAMGSSP